MRKQVAIKNHTEEIHLITRRCIVASIIMAGLIAILMLRLVWLQVVKHHVFTTLSEKNWLDLVPVEPTRGLIYDRNGILLAENIPVFSLEIIPNKVDHLPDLLYDLSKIIQLSPNDIAQFHRQLKQHRRFDEVTLKLRLSEPEVARFAENQYHLNGAFVKAQLIRHYPFANTFSHVLGYVGRINPNDLKHIDATNYSATTYIGKSGIEKFYENTLHGKVGYEQTENDASGQALRILNKIHPEPGHDLWLTIDSRLQMAAEKAFENHRGALVAIDPNTGEILALVSEPGFDPNNFITGISNQDYQNLQNSTDRPLYNRAIRGLYPPGSTIKPFIALEGLDSGTTTPDLTIYDPGWYRLENSNHVFRDWWRQGHGSVNLEKAIVSSCDVYFFDLAHHMGIQAIDDILDRFGFGQLTGIDMSEEIPGVLSSPAWKRRFKQQPWYEGDTLNSVIGQGFMQFTPLQLAQGAAALANHGQRFIPHLVREERDTQQNHFLHRPDPQPAVLLENAGWWNFVRDAMVGVITTRGGTGYHFGRPKQYTVAAKTGTAQVHSMRQDQGRENQNDLPERLRDNSLFIGFAPIQHPQIAIAVVAENDNAAASEIARKVLDHYFLGDSASHETPIH
ncbi:MAG: penicillin-binding protein 2 [Gammaproteobacteria bacterium]|nr:penicillin-binding protein 2 [Gammaproteobacteria bacterium]